MKRTKQACLRIGHVIDFLYPTRNRHNVPLEYVPERMTIVRIRDLSRRPVTAGELNDRPLVRRGSLLIIGIDHHTGDVRHCYAEAMRARSGLSIPLPSFQLGLYAPRDNKEPDYIGPIYQPCPFDQIAMKAAAVAFAKWKATRPDLPYRLGAFPLPADGLGSLVSRLIVNRWPLARLPSPQTVRVREHWTA